METDQRLIPPRPMSVGIVSLAGVLVGALANERPRWALWAPVLVGAGIAVYFSLTVEPPLWAGFALSVATLALAWRLRRHELAMALALGVFLLALGFAVAGLRTWAVAAPVITERTGPVSIIGEVTRLEVLESGQRVTLSRLRISNIEPGATPETVRIKLMGKQPAMRPGDWVRLRGELMAPPPPAVPGAFDFQRQSYFRGLGGVGFSYGSATVTPAMRATGMAALTLGIERLREAVAGRVRESLSGDAGAIAAALMTGERGAISKPVMPHRRDSGLAHLLAISGLHVGLVAGIVFFAVRAFLALFPVLALRYPIKKWAAVAAIAGAFFYAQLAGATVPTQRAFIMIALALAAVLFDRQPISMRPVAWAALVILLLAPESLLGASFQLSFAAVVALVAVYEAVREGGKLSTPKTWQGRVALYLLGVALTTLIAGTATSGFAAFHFNRVAVYGLAANLVAVPVTALWVMPLAVAAYALMPFGLEGLVLQPMSLGIEAVMASADTVAGLPGAVRAVSAMPAWGLALLAFGGLWAALWRGPVRRLGFVVMVAGLTSSWALTAPDVLVSGDGRLMAVHDNDGGYLLSNLRRASFQREVWLRRAGLNTAAGRWPSSSTSSSKAVGTNANSTNAVTCDALGCLYQKQNTTFAFANTATALAEDCALANVAVVLKAPALAGVGACPPTTRLVTPAALKREGAHAFWIEGQGRIKTETVNGVRGQRPWVIGR